MKFSPLEFIVCLAIFLVIFFVPDAFAAIVINEILFDPAGSDTGQEVIELYNPGAESADLTGWQLYPDGIGYFTFPSFSLQPHSTALVHLRSAGTDDGANLYHAAAAANMGNSSGSVALFKPGGRDAATIADFVRYHKPGSTERKTWESAAAEAGLWTTGDFVNTAAAEEGQSIALKTDGARGGSGAWVLQTSPPFSSQNDSGQVNATGTQTSSTRPPENAPADSGRPLPPSLRAWAGEDATAIAGSEIVFRGMAYGLNGEALGGVRMLWNFGDGSWAEGRAAAHVYRFPGTYYANLTVHSGEYSGSDWRMLTVLPSGIFTSEVLPGAGGFIEITNTQKSAVDLGGILLVDDQSHSFRVPENTRIGAEAAIVFANAVTGLDPLGNVILRDAAGREIDRVSWQGYLEPDASWKRSGRTMAGGESPTPGTAAGITLASRAVPVGKRAGETAGPEMIRLSGTSAEGKRSAQARPSDFAPEPEVRASMAAAAPRINSAADKKTAAAAPKGMFRSRLFFPALAILASAGAAVLFFVLKRMAF